MSTRPKNPVRILLAVLAAAVAVAAAVPAVAAEVRVAGEAGARTLEVDGRPMMVFGMNWDHVPIGENYMWSLWMQPDDVIQVALDRDMPLLQAMHVNAIRQYNGIPPRWVKYIYEKYGIWTIINHPMARYGYTLDGVWIPSVDYSDPKLRAAVKAEILALVDEFRGTPGMLMWLLGNENNYG
ncbi:MAG TPA: glycoside hydrolase family 2 TIM barrel-domain containing protein, partial [Candidatus Krumholzibacteria bacterium]|nr:glycoside hydrolase family 2 TIM barrel-domain containing protein [Candidatus Krumholzibacteria bacterium]